MVLPVTPTWVCTRQPGRDHPSRVLAAERTASRSLILLPDQGGCEPSVIDLSLGSAATDISVDALGQNVLLERRRPGIAAYFDSENDSASTSLKMRPRVPTSA